MTILVRASIQRRLIARSWQTRDHGLEQTGLDTFKSWTRAPAAEDSCRQQPPPSVAGTVTMSKTPHISTSPKLLCKAYSPATLKHSKPLLLEIWLGVITLAPDL
jgi:hypothetical protein